MFNKVSKKSFMKSNQIRAIECPKTWPKNTQKISSPFNCTGFNLGSILIVFILIKQSSSSVQVNNYETVINFFDISHNLT